jgi:SAM-dependent methyltransferase
VSTFSRDLIGRSGYANEGFADHYDGARPGPPAVVLDVLARCAGGRPRLVVDLGSGTGLSSRAWAARADRVVGVEANPAMLTRAQATTSDANVTFVEGYADATGLETGSADIVTCAQSFHWMDPTAVLPEVARVLRPGGVFGAYDYDIVPVIEPQVDAAFAAVIDVRWAARERLGIHAGASVWPKHEHATRLRESGLFAFVREVHCHAETTADAEAVINLAHSLGGPTAIFAGRAPELDETMDDLTRIARERLPEARPMLVGYTIRLGITLAG